MGNFPILSKISRVLKFGIPFDTDKHSSTHLGFTLKIQIKSTCRLWEDWADESLYFYEVYLRVNDSEALEEAIRIGSIGRPAYEKPMVKGFILAELKTQLFFQGLGRMKAENVEEEFIRHLDRIEQVLSQSEWLVGNSQTIADIAVVAQLGEVIRTSKNLVKKF